MLFEDPPVEWHCNARSRAFVLRLESLIAILDVDRSVEPFDASGNFKVFLTEAAASSLAKVDELDLWTVGHTMVRGQTKVCGDVGALDFNGKKAAPKRRAKRKAEAAGLEGGQQKEIPLTDESFRRTSSGRLAIKKFMEEIYGLDVSPQSKTARAHLCRDQDPQLLKGLLSSFQTLPQLSRDAPHNSPMRP